MYRVYYSDGTTHEGPNPPPRDVQVILEKDGDDWILRSGGDYYVFRDGIWVEVDIFGLFDFLMDSGIVLFGRTIGNAQYTKILMQAMRDREQIA